MKPEQVILAQGDKIKTADGKKTGKVYWAGTDNKIFVKFKGEKGAVWVPKVSVIKEEK